jgi:DNA-binding NarL/FixJ family response regulator
MVDDHPVVREGIRNLLDSRSRFHVVAEAGSLSEARALMRQPLPKTVGYLVVDVHLNDGSGIDIVREARSLDSPLDAVVVTAFPSVRVLRRAIAGGARGIVLKEAGSSSLLCALTCVARGHVFLDPLLGDLLVDALISPHAIERDLYDDRLLGLLADGLTDKEIARVVGKTPTAVTHDVAALLKRMGASSRAAAVNQAVERGILSSLPYVEE